jgi:hypothetical protein
VPPYAEVLEALCHLAHHERARTIREGLYGCVELDEAEKILAVFGLGYRGGS